MIGGTFRTWIFRIFSIARATQDVREIGVAQSAVPVILAYLELAK